MTRYLDTQKVQRSHDVSKVARRAERVLFSLLLCFALGAFVYGFYFLVFFSPFLQVHKIEVVGKFVNVNEADVRATCPLKEGERLFLLSVNEIQDRISRLPWVRAVSVRRRLPDTLWISVEEYQPYALLAADKLYLIDEQGIIFKSLAATDPKNLPVLSGMIAEEKDKLSVFNVQRGLLDQGLQLLKQFEVSQLNAGNAVSEIHYDPLQGFSVLTKDRPMQVVIGKNDFSAKIQRLDQFWQALPQSQRVRYLALISDDQIIVKFAKL